MTIRPSEIGGTAAYLDVGTGDNEIPTNSDLPIKAWGVIDQTGVQSILESEGISSITDIGVGLTKINFTTDMVDVNYSIVGSVTNNPTGSVVVYISNTLTVKLVGSFDLQVVTSAGGGSDTANLCFQVVR